MSLRAALKRCGRQMVLSRITRTGQRERSNVRALRLGKAGDRKDEERSGRACHPCPKIYPIGLTPLMHEQLDELDRSCEDSEPNPERERRLSRERPRCKQSEGVESDEVEQLVIRIPGDAKCRDVRQDEDREDGQGKND